jgi:hypothetical protein
LNASGKVILASDGPHSHTAVELLTKHWFLYEDQATKCTSRSGCDQAGRIQAHERFETTEFATQSIARERQIQT